MAKVRVLVLGGTNFIGRAIVEALVADRHRVTVVHRGVTEPEDLAAVHHLHLSREELPSRGGELRGTDPHAIIDCSAMTRAHARAALEPMPTDLRMIVLSSQDVYRAFASLQQGTETDAVPVEEASPLRPDRHPYRGKLPGEDEYSKQDVEDEYLERGAIVLRLPVTYGEHDDQRREEFILRRVRAGRRRIPIGPAALLLTRGYVQDVARGVSLVLGSDDSIGGVFNVGEAKSWSVRMWAERILEAAEHEAELVTVPDPAIPSDMQITRSRRQHFLVDTRRARAAFGYTDSDPMEALRRSVRWHFEHPPTQGSASFDEDDRALSQ
jgi:nucleoside-diphosphate-sugar epimerase